MKFLTPLMVFMGIFCVNCSHSPKIPHIGERISTDTAIKIDSIHISADSTSLRGNFALMDSSLIFVDNTYCKLFEFNINNGKLAQTYSGYGQGPNEMTGIMFGSVVHPSDTSMWIFDSSNGIYEFTPVNGKVEYKGKLDFSWTSETTDDLASTACYGLMEMSDFGLSVNQIADSVILIPLSLINRKVENIKSARYTDARIFGKVNPETLAIIGLEGRFPDIYKESPMPAFEFFDYTVDYCNSRIYVNHAPDPLIYCYDFNGNVVNSLGLEAQGINRNYTKGYEPSFETFKKDIAHVGSNTGVYYDSDNGLLFRTSLANFPSGRSIMQIYKDNNLILEQEMPPYFKLLGKYGTSYYGVRFIPLDDGNDARFTLYRLSLTS